MFLSLPVFTFILTNPHSLLAVAVVIWVSPRQSLLATSRRSSPRLFTEQHWQLQGVADLSGGSRGGCGTVFVKSAVVAVITWASLTTHSPGATSRLASSVLSALSRCATLYLLYCIFTVSFVCLDTQKLTVVSQCPTAFRTVTGGTGLQPRSNRLYLRPRCVVGYTRPFPFV